MRCYKVFKKALIFEDLRPEITDFPRKSTADLRGTKSTADPPGKSNADSQTTTINWNQFKFKK